MKHLLLFCFTLSILALIVLRAEPIQEWEKR